MTVSAFLLVALFVFCLYQLAAAIHSHRIAKKYQAIRYKALTQQAFGKARHNLFKLVAEGKLSATSITFLTFYPMTTTVMRRPDRYPEIAELVRESFLNPEGGDLKGRTALMEESRLWPVEMKQVVSQIDLALTKLLFYHSPLLKFFHTMFMRTFRIVSQQRAEELAAKQNPDNRTIIEAKHRLRALAA